MGETPSTLHQVQAPAVPHGFEEWFGVIRVGSVAPQEVLQSGQTFRRRIDRAADLRSGLAARRKRPQGDDQVLQLHDGPPRGHAHDPAGRIGHPAFGRAGQNDVLAVGIVEDVADPQQPGQVAHLVGQCALVVENGLLQPIERNLPQSAEGGDLGIEGGTGRGDPLSHELSAGIGVDLGAEHAVGVDGNAGGGVAADTAAASCCYVCAQTADGASATSSPAAKSQTDQQPSPRQRMAIVSSPKEREIVRYAPTPTTSGRGWERGLESLILLYH